MKKILKEVQSGKFAREWIRENKRGRPNFNELHKKDDNHPIEIVGKELRRMMEWIR
jgi:ketol-acid reductoisomerase